jgi:hemerythrin-like domain-containing protein
VLRGRLLNTQAMQGSHFIDMNKVSTRFAAFISLMDQTCEELEKITDSLPRSIDPHTCLDLAQRMLPLIKRAHDFEEQEVWPLVRARTSQSAEMQQTLDRLSFEHWGDEDFAEQVFHQLRDYAMAPEASKADTLAWALRGFFQNMQRHLAFEREFLLPLLKTPQGAHAHG